MWQNSHWEEFKQRVRKRYFSSLKLTTRKGNRDICLKNLKARSKEGHTDYKAWTFSPEGKGDTILKCHITVVFITYSLWNTERLKKEKRRLS